MNKILYTLHVMWYEHLMINETLDSLEQAIANVEDPIDLIVCLNSQTYIEKPDEGINPEELFNTFLNHPVLKTATIIKKTDKDAFYNIGDWARDIYGPKYDYRYIVWGESDCLVPEDYFFLLQNINIDHPHIVSLATRKMWDTTWDEVEHPWIHQFPRDPAAERLEQAPIPFNCGDYITLEQLNEFNRQYEPTLIRLSQPKVDGCMTAVSQNFPHPFIAEGLHIGGHDFYMELFMKKNGIPQYHIATRLKGHNCVHPNKRVGTSTARGGVVYKQYAEECNNLIQKLIHE